MLTSRKFDDAIAAAGSHCFIAGASPAGSADHEIGHCYPVFVKPASEQPAPVDVGRERARLARRVEWLNARVDVRQIGANLRQTLFISVDCAEGFVARPAKRGDRANGVGDVELGQCF